MTIAGSRSPQHPAWATGVLAGAVTPFDDKLRIDEGAFRRHVAWLADAGVASIVVAADTGEGHHLSPEERLRLVAVAVEEVGERTPVLCGLIAGHTGEATESARRAEAAGAAGLQVFPPPAFLGPPLDPVLAAAFFDAIGTATTLPLLAYRPPLVLGFPITDAVLEQILAVDAVVALKESSFDESTYEGSLALTRRFPDVAFMSGADTFVHRSLEIGADGAALALAAVAPRSYVRALRAARGHGEAPASDILDAIEALPNTVFARPFRDFRARLKEALRGMGLLENAAVRPPLMPLSAAECLAVSEMIASAELVARET